MSQEKVLQFELVTPEKKLFSEEVYEVILPTKEGQISVFPDHVPVVSILKSGVLALRRTIKTPDADLEHVALSGGYVEITGNRVRVLADSAERAEEISELRAEQAKKRAEELIGQSKDTQQTAEAAAMLERALTRIKVASLKKRRSHHGPMASN
ncbi:ATP synthase F1 subunit epsilon [Candidatus Berkelbacteria bacterium]|nr:ATP synthase F1 subunit epsilon [Candidatus Berkelbacteria bacterium]